MCGIAGFCDYKSQTNEDILIRMTDQLIHRGPDDSGYKTFQFQNARVGLGHRRLSIIDLSPLGHQPMSFDEFDIVFNGEIYNFNELRKELQDYGIVFKSHSDTEVILAGYARWGIDVINKFVGMFAFALLDRKRQRLFLVRDRVGVKPLYYYQTNDIILFASEIKSFHQHQAFSKRICERGLTNFIQFGYTISPNTIFQDTFKVNPGCYLEIDLTTQHSEEKTYWKIEDYYHNKVKLDNTEILSHLESLLVSATNYRMVSDVPVGLFLSGGYDSSMVAAILQKGRTEKIKTFTIGFHEKEFNEAPHAKKVAEYLSTDHTEYYCSIDDALKVIPEIPHFFDEPFADYSAIPTMLVSKMARQKVTVALSADGGDEIFGGYPKYLQALTYQKWASSVPRSIAKTLHYVYQGTTDRLLTATDALVRYRSTNSKISELIRNQTGIDFARINVQQFEESSIKRLLGAHMREEKQNYFYNNEFFQSYEDLDQLLMLDFKVYLPDDLLVKIDRSTMSVSLEGREPLLDHRLVEFMGSINAYSKVNYKQHQTKYFLREIAHRHIPSHILDRPKMGFTPPLTSWLKGPLKEQVLDQLSESKINQQQIFNYREIANVKKEFFDLGYSKSAKKIWNLFMFQMWYNKWMK
jgi:asparagine synthase (glutamine-hydrolyzing)